MIKNTSQHFIAVVSPSNLSGIVTTIASLLTIGIAVVASYGPESVLQQGIFAAHSLSAPTYRQITDNLAQNPVFSNAPLFLFWAAVGLIIYLLAINIVTAFGSGVRLEEELGYVNSQRSKLIRFEIIVAIVRAGILAGWLLYVQVFLKLLLPYALAAAHSARLNSAPSGIGQISLAVLVLFIGIHLHLIFLRLLLLKTRVFADSDAI